MTAVDVARDPTSLARGTLRVSRYSPSVLRALVRHGVQHTLDAKSVARFWGRLEPPVRIADSKLFHDTFLGAFTYLSGGLFYHTHAGRYCSFAYGLHVGQGNHPMEWLSTHPFQYQNLVFSVGDEFADREIYEADAAEADNSRVPKPGRTLIGNDVWVGQGAYIGNGVTVGDGAVIGARSVVVKDVPPYAIVVGTPARIVRYRFSPELVDRLLRVRWWRFAPWQIRSANFADPTEALDRIELLEAEGMIPYEPAAIEITRN